ncbi:MAG: hypothetical protein ABIX36_23475 [Mucilaginibacter sp.]|uniref:hypothetical protein n=1 Tax=Mucilaginibacter sp. TaxID=1882438 RepID=UPI00326756CF
MNSEKTTTTPPIRSWLGIPYATAKRFRRPILLPVQPGPALRPKGACTPTSR